MNMSEDEQANSYLETISALRRFTQQKAGELAHDLLAQAGLDDLATEAQNRWSRLSEEFSAAGKANREMLQQLIRGEVDKAMGRLRFARSEEVSDLRSEVDELQARLDQLEAEQNGGAGWAEPEGYAAPQQEPLVDPLIEAALAEDALLDVAAPPATTKKSPAKKSPTKKSPAKKAPATAPGRATGQKTAAKKPAAEKSVASARKSTSAKKSAARKTAPSSSTAPRSAARATAKRSAPGAAAGVSGPTGS